jgi:hypothetical protein
MGEENETDFSSVVEVEDCFSSEETVEEEEDAEEDGTAVSISH